ncbi:hypothetical protein ACOMHN_060219 [Nucella lapillus]
MRCGRAGESAPKNSFWIHGIEALSFSFRCPRDAQLQILQTSNAKSSHREDTADVEPKVVKEETRIARHTAAEVDAMTRNE